MTHINPDLIKALRAQYGHECRICGAEMELQDSRDMAFACVPVSEDDPTRPGKTRWRNGRSFIDEHYSASRTYIRAPKDESVIAVLDRLAELESEVPTLRTALSHVLAALACETDSDTIESLIEDAAEKSVNPSQAREIFAALWASASAISGHSPPHGDS